MTKLRCTILDDYQQVALSMADWSMLAPDVEVASLGDHLEGPALVDAIVGSEILVVMRERTPITAELLGRLPKLRLVITSGMRNGSIDIAEATARGVTVCGTASASTPPTELTWALILGLARNITCENDAFRHGGPWQQTVGADLCGKQLGLLGLGKIGSRVAAIGLAFGMKVVAWSSTLTAERAAAAGVTLMPSKEALLETSDFVSIHLVLGARTCGLVGAAELARMRPSAFLINTSRAAIVEQEALVSALQAGRIAGAGLDVFDVEPLPRNHPLRALPTVLATPHLGYVTKSNYDTYFREAVEDIRSFLAGEPIRRLEAK